MVSISTRTLWRLVSTKRFPEPLHVGGSTRWRLADVERWIDEGCTDFRNDQQ
jgi:predicted DNA-binding transcriptional regulator AlpA